MYRIPFTFRALRFTYYVFRSSRARHIGSPSGPIKSLELLLQLVQFGLQNLRQRLTLGVAEALTHLGRDGVNLASHSRGRRR